MYEHTLMKIAIKTQSFELRELGIQKRKIRDKLRSGKLSVQYTPHNVLFFSELSSLRDGWRRAEARLHFLAYGFLCGHKYVEVESNSKKKVNWDDVLDVVLSYTIDRKENTAPAIGNSEEIEEQTILQQFAEWVEEAKTDRNDLYGEEG